MKPPGWAQRLLRWVLRPQDREVISGDLLEEYCEVHQSFGDRRARRRYLAQVISIVATEARRRVSATPILILGWVLLFFALSRDSESPTPPPAHTIPADPHLFLAITTILLVAVFVGVFLVVGWLWFVLMARTRRPLRRPQ
jgi:hypothetical protein